MDQDRGATGLSAHFKCAVWTAGDLERARGKLCCIDGDTMRRVSMKFMDYLQDICRLQIIKPIFLTGKGADDTPWLDSNEL